MPSVAVTGFLSEMKSENLKKLKKSELLELVLHFKLGDDVKSSWRKQAIVRTLAEYFVDENIFSEDELVKFPELSSAPSMSETEAKVRLMELELEKEKLKLEDRERERRFELEKLAGERVTNVRQNENRFMASREVRLVPPFDETEVDKYFQHFEKVADSLNWPKAQWSLMLQSVIKGKAQIAYSSLSLSDSADYERVKAQILKAYELVPEAYRQKFRNLRKVEGQTYVEFAHDKEVYFERWCSSMTIDSNFERLKELMLIEEFKRCVRDDVKSFLDEKEASTLHQAARLADEYALTHKKFTFNQNNRSQTQNSTKSQTQNSSNDTKGKFSGGNKSSSGGDNSDRKERSGPTCPYCKKYGHVLSECLALKRKKERESQLHGNGLVKSLVQTPFLDSNKSRPSVAKDAIQSDSLMDEFLPFVSEGFVSHTEGSTSTPIRILRDTGASQSLLMATCLPSSDETATGDYVLCQGIEGRTISVPLHSIFLQSDLVTGQFKVGLIDSLPMKGVSLLLGNDLAGGKVVPSVQLSAQPLTDDDLVNTNVFTSCAVTRAMAEKAKQEEDPVQLSTLHDCETSRDSYDDQRDFVFDNLSDTFLATLFHQDSDCSQSLHMPESGVSDFSLSRKQLIKAQADDVEVSELMAKALSIDDIAKVPIGFYWKDGVLMRKFRPPDVAADEEWAVVSQVVVPKVYRNEILSMAHNLPLGGHLGVNKTVDKILRQFFWPGLRKDVSQFCKSCHACQVVGKHKSDPPVAPLQPIPAFGEPFSKVIIDCVGPLPRTKSGNQYLLTIMCSATRFPEAIPLRNIKAASVSKALIKFFTLFGLPKEIQSDQGSNFTSKLFQQVVYELGVKQITSSAYHPESQGALERFHSTLKTMLRTFCYENGKEWDAGVHLLLFAARESVQESLGFSPFELVFGHRVRGPLSLLSEQWTNEDIDIGLLDYVLKFKERLYKACLLAQQNLKSSQRKMKTWYDKKARARVFKPGDKVLVLFPLKENPLQARFHGPYEIHSKVNDLNYIVKTPDRRKPKQLCHINMLKPYFDRPVGGMISVDQPGFESECHSKPIHSDEPPIKSEILSCKLPNSEILQNIDLKVTHLNPVQQEQMKGLINSFKELFPDVPKRTSVAVHDVDVGDARPIKQHPYRMSPEKVELAEKEVAYMLENEIIRPSHSPWSSPCVLVPKPNGSIRFCTDYRKVNSVSKTDVFPIPRIDDCIDRVGKAKFLTKIDLLKGYWCVPLTERAREISAFVTPSGLYEYNVLPFGMKNAPATFQRMIQSVIQGLPNTNAYIDDLVTGSDSWEEHLQDVGRLFQRLSEANMTVNLSKCEFGCATVTYLGHVIGQGQVAPVDAKVEAILEFPVPNGKKALRRFLGMIGYYRKFCRNFADIALPLTNLLKGNIKFVWNDSCQKAFDTLKTMLCHFPILRSPNFQKMFSVAVDASDEAAGAVLLQSGDEDGVEHPVAFFSKKFTPYQRNYSTIEKELLAMILAIQHFEVYLYSGSKPLTVYSDHNPLVFLNKMKNKNRRLLNWSLLLQEYVLEIKHVKGKDNVIADCLSR